MKIEGTRGPTDEPEAEESGLSREQIEAEICLELGELRKEILRLLTLFELGTAWRGANVYARNILSSPQRQIGKTIDDWEAK